MQRRLIFYEQIIITAQKLVINIWSIHDAWSEKHQVRYTYLYNCFLLPDNDPLSAEIYQF